MSVMSLLERVTPAFLQSHQKDMVSFRLCSSHPEVHVSDELYLKTIVSLHYLEKKLNVMNTDGDNKVVSSDAYHSLCPGSKLPEMNT